MIDEEKIEQIEENIERKLTKFEKRKLGIFIEEEEECNDRI